MKTMKKIGFILFLGFLLTSCQEEATIKVQNMLPKAVISNVEWGGVPLSSKILPGQSSSKMEFKDGFGSQSYYDISFPASYPLKFYIVFNGDMVYVQTRESYRLDADDDLVIVIDDSTKVFNPLIESQE